MSPPPPPHTHTNKKLKFGLEHHLDYTILQVDLIQMDDYPVDSCAISPMASMLT